MDHIAQRVAEYLELDMPRILYIAFQDHPRIAERAGGFALCGGEGVGKFRCAADDAHALATTAGRGLDHQRKAGLAGLFGKIGGVLILAVVAGHQRHDVLFHQRLGGGLGAHRVDTFRARANERYAGLRAGAGEAGVLGQKTITGVDGLRTGLLRHLKDGLATKIGVGRTRAADRPRFIGEAHMLRVPVRFGIDRDGMDAESATGADHAAGDLATIGYQYAFEHAGFLEPFVSMQSQ